MLYLLEVGLRPGRLFALWPGNAIRHLLRHKGHKMERLKQNLLNLFLRLCHHGALDKVHQSSCPASLALRRSQRLPQRFLCGKWAQSSAARTSNNHDCVKPFNPDQRRHDVNVSMPIALATTRGTVPPRTPLAPNAVLRRSQKLVMVLLV